jgi:hypothetical protein
LPYPYLTPEELAAELEISTSAANELIAEGRIPAIEPSRGLLVVSRLALDTYRRRASGDGTPIPPIEFSNKSLDERRDEFEAATGMSAAEWERRWAAEEIEDSAENMRLAVQAASLLLYGAGSRSQRAPLRRDAKLGRRRRRRRWGGVEVQAKTQPLTGTLLSR